MIDTQEAQQLMEKFIELRQKSQESKSPQDISAFQKHEKLCIEKFSYLVTMRTNRYKVFSNYDDLNQEGYEALVKAMKNYNPKKGSWFWWAHKYIDTRIARSANLHTTIRFPLKVARENAPHKESVLPILIEENYCPDKELENSQLTYSIEQAMIILNEQQKSILNLAYGIDGNSPISVAKICRRLNISRSVCKKTIDTALALLKDKIKI